MARPLAILVQAPPELMEYSRAIGVSAIFASLISPVSQVMAIPVPVDHFRNSPPFGAVMVVAETDGSVESIVNVTMALAVLESLSFAVRRSLALLISRAGGVQASLPSLATSVVIGVQMVPPSVEYSRLIGVAIGLASVL